MNYQSATAPVLHVMHTIEIPFYWNDNVVGDDGAQHEACERIDGEVARLSGTLPIFLDLTGSDALYGVRIKGSDLVALTIAAEHLAAFMAKQGEIKFLRADGE